MAPFHPHLPTTILVVLLIAAGAAAHTATGACRRLPCYSRVFSFGNSLTDTGNAAIFPLTAGGSFTQPPYGETHFGHPSGRASDGRLVVDFLGNILCTSIVPILSSFVRCEFVIVTLSFGFARSGGTEGAAADAVPRRQHGG